MKDKNAKNIDNYLFPSNHVQICATFFQLFQRFAFFQHRYLGEKNKKRRVDYTHTDTQIDKQSGSLCKIKVYSSTDKHVKISFEKKRSSTISNLKMAEYETIENSSKATFCYLEIAVLQQLAFKLGDGLTRFAQTDLQLLHLFLQLSCPHHVVVSFLLQISFA